MKGFMGVDLNDSQAIVCNEGHDDCNRTKMRSGKMTDNPLLLAWIRPPQL